MRNDVQVKVIHSIDICVALQTFLFHFCYLAILTLFFSFVQRRARTLVVVANLQVKNMQGHTEIESERHFKTENYKLKCLHFIYKVDNLLGHFRVLAKRLCQCCQKGVLSNMHVLRLIKNVFSACKNVKRLALAQSSSSKSMASHNIEYLQCAVTNFNSLLDAHERPSANYSVVVDFICAQRALTHSLTLAFSSVVLCTHRPM